MNNLLVVFLTLTMLNINPLFSQSEQYTLKYFVPENSIIEYEYFDDGLKRVTYWADSSDITNYDKFPVGIDVFSSSNEVLHYTRYFDSIGYAVTFRLNGTINTINIFTESITNIIHYHSNGVVAQTGIYDNQLNLEDDHNETGVHCEYDETGQLISYKLYDKGVLLNMINYK